MTGHLNLDIVKQSMEGLGTAEQVNKFRIRIKTTPERIPRALLIAQKILKCDHLITISAVDNGTMFELMYHMTGPHRTVLSFAIELPRDNPEVHTVSDILPPAGIYERQIHDLLGIGFLGHPDLKRIILNEDWPTNEFPMRKDWKPDPGTFYGGIRKEVT
jgi:NADH:ubiquinone oxidoreductase subunit C